MSRIDIENAKTLREAMKVICGLDVEVGDIEAVTATNSYDNYVGSLTSVTIPNMYMDLMGEGFLNDGNAVSLPSNHAGIVSKINYLMTISITLDTSVGAGVPIMVYGYEGDELKKWTSSTIEGTAQSVSIEASAKRIFITKVNVGESWWFDNSNLISCNVQLRGVDTSLDNPTLQMSEIEIKGYEPNDITDLLDKIDENNPIYYSAGYVGDMSPVRKFYLSGMVEWENNVITIKGADATKFLDSDYAGKYYTNASFKKAIEDILDSANIEYTESGTEEHAMTPLLVTNGSARDFIAQACNLIRGTEMTSGSGYEIAYDYVDAGIPTLKIWSPSSEEDAITLANIADLKRSISKAFKGVKVGIVSPVSETIWTELQTVEMTSGVAYWIDSNEPCTEFSCSGGTVTMLSPYRVKIVASSTGTFAINGKVIKSAVPDDLSEYVGPYLPDGWEVPMTIDGWREYGEILDVGTINCTGEHTFERRGEILKYSIILELLAQTGEDHAPSERSNVLYEFTYRGDPRLQPRDIIKVNVDGTDIVMTIDNLSLEHEGGGLKSKIVARKGVI